MEWDAREFRKCNKYIRRLADKYIIADWTNDDYYQEARIVWLTLDTPEKFRKAYQARLVDEIRHRIGRNPTDEVRNRRSELLKTASIANDEGEIGNEPVSEETPLDKLIRAEEIATAVEQLKEVGKYAANDTQREILQMIVELRCERGFCERVGKALGISKQRVQQILREIGERYTAKRPAVTPTSIRKAGITTECLQAVDLTKLERDCMTMFLAGKEYQQIADELGVSRKTVDNATTRARAKIRKQQGN